MKFQEACQTLGVAPQASMPEVKKAYRNLARRYHPDQNPAASAVDRFREIQEAYNLILSLNGGVKQKSIPATATPTEAPTPPTAPASPRKLRRVPRVGSEVSGKLTLSFKEVFQGTTTEITFTDSQGCETCGATGAAPGSAFINCPSCQGQNHLCDTCAGRGVVPSQPCPTCYGEGVVDLQRQVKTEVPRSVEDGEERVIKEKGKWGMERRGDIRLRIEVKTPPHMSRKGKDVEVEVPINVLQAVLGGYAYVPTLEDLRHKITISPGSSSGKRYRIKGEGFYDRHTGERGDLYAIISINVPTQLTEREQYLYQLLLEEEVKKAQGEETQA